MNISRKNLIRLTILTTGIVFVFVGISRKEHYTVLIKAINVCLECIGIG